MVRGAIVVLSAGCVAANAGAMFINSGDLSDQAIHIGHVAANPANPMTGGGFSNPNFWELWTFTVDTQSEVTVDITRLVNEFDAAAAVYIGDATGLPLDSFPSLGQHGALQTFAGGFSDDIDPNPFGTGEFFGDPRIEFTTPVLGASQVYSVFVVNNAGGFLAEGYDYEISVTYVEIPGSGSAALMGLAGLAVLRRQRGA